MNQLITMHQNNLEQLCRRYNVQRLELFGSAAITKTESEIRDLDFLVEFANPKLSGYANAYFGLLESLQLLFNKPVDLVMISAVKNPYFLQSINRNRTTLSMQLEAKKFLYDIQQSAQLIVKFTDAKTFDNYSEEEMLRSAVERQFEIIGEALSQLAKLDPAIAEKITGYQRIIAFRNILIHGYAQVDDRVVWDVLKENLPVLVNEVKAFLNK